MHTHRTQRTVLIVDDDGPIRRLVAVWLRREGLVVETAANGAEGVARAKELQPDLILLDVEMPVLDGFAACRQLKSAPETADLPVIFLTGATDTTERIRGLDLGAVDYVLKPFEPAEFLARVRAALRTKRLLDLLAEKAQIDGLTGLRNRRYLDERLPGHMAQLQRSNQAFSVIMVDLDRFKALNDTHGHGFGDQVLVSVSEALKATCRAEDTVCRYGGEELCVITPGVGRDGAAHLAERLREAVARLQFISGKVNVPVTISLGVAQARPDESIDGSGVVRRADTALYAAKKAGRDRVAVDGQLPPPADREAA